MVPIAVSIYHSRQRVTNALGEWYIETAMGTMTYQWLATWFIPKDIIEEVMVKRYLMNEKQAGVQSSWFEDFGTEDSAD